MINRVWTYVTAALLVATGAQAQSPRVHAEAAHDACVAHVTQQPQATAAVARLAHEGKDTRRAVSYKLLGHSGTGTRDTIDVEFLKTGKKCLIVYNFTEDESAAAQLWARHLGFMQKANFVETETRRFNGGNWHFYSKGDRQISMMGYADQVYGRETHMVVTYKRKN